MISNNQINKMPHLVNLSVHTEPKSSKGENRLKLRSILSWFFHIFVVISYLILPMS